MLPRFSLLTLALLQMHSAYSTPTLFSGDYPTRVTGQFLTGDDHQLGGFADGMFPLLQNNERLFFADGTFMLGRYQQSMYSGGMGYRQMAESKVGRGIWGVYGFADYYQTALHNGFWQLNPGIEWLNQGYEARLQGYIPLNSRNMVYQHTLASLLPQNVLSDTNQNLSAINFATGHQIYNTPVNWLEESGMGVELEGGAFFNYGKGMWLRAGGYHFDYESAKSINGLEANLEILMTKGASLLIQNNYDNQNKNQFSVGVRISFGGSPAEIGTLEQRMTSPIIRHLARQSYGEAAPTRQSFEATGPTFLEYDNVWFFSPYGMAPQGALTTVADCTAEHPCLTIDSPTAAQINTLSPAAKFFFASGNYLLPAESNGASWVGLQDGQSVWGRRTGWLQAANSLDRPLINGGLNWNGTTNASGAVYDMRIFNNNQIIPNADTNFTSDVRMGLGANGSLTVHNTAIQVAASGSLTDSYAIGVYATEAAVVNNSLININNSSNADVYVFGVSAENNNVTVNNSSIHLYGTSIDDVFMRGVNSDFADAFINNSEIIMNSLANSGESLIGIKGTNSTVNTSKIVVQGTSGDSNSEIHGVFAINDVVVNSTQVMVSGSSTVLNETYGVTANLGNATVINSQIVAVGNSTTDNNFSTGVRATNDNATIQNSYITSSGTSSTGTSTSYGVEAATILFNGNAPSYIVANGISPTNTVAAVDGTVTNRDGSQCTTNGNTVTCM